MTVALDQFLGNAGTPLPVAASVAQGEIVAVVYRGGTTAPADAKGNTYQVIATAAGGGGRAAWVLAASILATALAAGDTITFAGSMGLAASFNGVLSRGVPSGYAAGAGEFNAAATGIVSTPSAVMGGDLGLAAAIQDDGLQTHGLTAFDAPWTPVLTGTPWFGMQLAYQVPSVGAALTAEVEAGSDIASAAYAIAVAGFPAGPRGLSMWM